ATASSLRAAASSSAHASMPCFAYVGSAEGYITVFATGSKTWKQIQMIVTAQPSSLVLHPNRDVLYVVNEIELFEHLPSGSVEAYTIRKDGHLSLLNRQPLSLSAVAPRHAAISPDGRTLVVSVHGGGAYNVLPIRTDGSLARVSAILKETGFGPDKAYQRTAHPQMVLFDNMGRVLSADMGNDCLSIFRLEKGRISILGRSRIHAGSGPRQMELHPDGHLLFVANALESSVVSYRYDSWNGRILEPLHRVSWSPSGNDAEAPTRMTMHPSGDFLYTASNLPDQAVTTWRINTANGSLSPIHKEWIEDSIHTLMLTPDDNSLLALSRSAGAVTRWQIDAEGRPQNSIQAAILSQPISMAMKYA
ncbi:MAG TPA: beta-propeller fold lactonase family protein, partial [Chroococcales cyanobacterium]